MKWYFPRRDAAGIVSRVLTLALLLAGAGCSENKRLTINGSVSYQGQPVPAGIVKFYGPGDRSSMAFFKDGAFSITDLTPGEVKVTVEPDPSQGKKSGAGPGGKSIAIPKKYSDPNTSGLVFTITPSTRELPIKLD